MNGRLIGIETVSRETLDRLETYADLLARWNQRINLVSPGTIKDLWKRHISDSIQLAALAPKRAETWIDLGSGAGLPGLIVAAARQDFDPLERMVVVDSDSRKCAFMSEAARAMNIPVEVRSQRLAIRSGEKAAEPFDIISARALAPLPLLLDYAAPFIKNTTICLFPKGKTRNTEIAEAQRSWHMKLEEIPSVSDPSGAVLRIREVSRMAESNEC